MTQTIRIGLVIKKPLAVVRACLKALEAQRLPPGVQLQYHAILDTDDAEVIHEVQEILAGNIVEVEPPVHGDFSDVGPTHHWTPSAMARVGNYKTRILQRALQDKVEAVWLVDADLLCDPGTLRSLWFADNPVVFGLFWTRWQNTPELHAAPQVWLRHPYTLDGRGYPNEAAFRRRLLTRQLTQVWGGGACTLIRKAVLEAGVNFDYVPGVSQEGMMAGEDRHFNIQCESRHIPMICDPWPHIFHVYHQDQIPEIEARLQQLASLQEGEIKWGSIRLKMLEPVPTGPGTFGLVPPHVVRVRFGSGQLLPDLERQVIDHLDGQPFVAAVHYPSTYEVDWLRGTRRLIDVMVIDYKNDTPFPTIEDEMGGEFDLTTYTSEQQAAMC